LRAREKERKETLIERFLYSLSIISHAFVQLTHHDGLTGTSKQHVAYDYARRLALGATVARLVVGDAFRELTHAPASVAFNACPLLNESICPDTMKNSFQVVVYNPLPLARTAHLSLPVVFSHAKVTDAATGAAVPAEVFLYRSRNELALAVPLCPLCTRVLRVSAAEANVATTHEPVQADAVNVIENEFLRVTIDAATGRISSILNKEDSVELPLDQNYQWCAHSSRNMNMRLYLCVCVCVWLFRHSPPQV
jgi:lysosomal alpha-mannosidase